MTTLLVDVNILEPSSAVVRLKALDDDSVSNISNEDRLAKLQSQPQLLMTQQDMLARLQALALSENETTDIIEAAGVNDLNLPKSGGDEGSLIELELNLSFLS